MERSIRCSSQRANVPLKLSAAAPIASGGSSGQQRSMLRSKKLPYGSKCISQQLDGNKRLFPGAERSAPSPTIFGWHQRI